MKALMILVSLFALSSAGPRGLAHSPELGRAVVWFDLEASDLAKAEEFYGKLFGWSFVQKEYQSLKFLLVRSEGKEIGGIAQSAGKVQAGSMAIYFETKDIHKSFALAVSLGATVYYPPMNIPGDDEQGSIALVKDPDGNAIGLYSHEVLP